MIRVFVVDDSPFVRKAIRRVLATDPEMRVVGEAATGVEALARLSAAEPDVVTLDIEMPGMNGIEVLRRLLEWRPGLRVIMLSAHTGTGAEATLEALAAGAADFIDKQSLNLMDLDRLGRELRDRIRMLGGPHRPKAPPPGLPETPAIDLTRAELCVIGASTGGPAAIQLLLEGLPADFPMPMAIVQHMPVGFTRPFAERLNGLCELRVREAVQGERLQAGQVVIAPAGQHLTLSSSLAVTLSTEPRNQRHTPSVDLLFSSAARACPGRVLGILLTGMGEDGAAGLGLIRASGGITIAESEQSCAVYGMPRVAVERGAVEHSLSLPAIAATLGGLRCEKVSSKQ